MSLSKKSAVVCNHLFGERLGRLRVLTGVQISVNHHVRTQWEALAVAQAGFLQLVFEVPFCLPAKWVDAFLDVVKTRQFSAGEWGVSLLIQVRQ